MGAPKAVVVVAASGLVVGTTARAGVIDPIITPAVTWFFDQYGPGLGPVATPGPGFQMAVGGWELTKPNNDNEPFQKPNRFQPDGVFSALGTIDIVTRVKLSAGMANNIQGGGTANTTEFRWESIISNQTGQDWQGFRYELGFGHMEWDAVNLKWVDNFVRSAAGDRLDWDTPHRDPAAMFNLNPLGIPGGVPFAGKNHQEDVLDWAAGVVKPNQSVFFDHRFDVPDFDANSGLPASALWYNGAVLEGYHLTLRLTPLVPAPGTALVLGAGVVMAGRRRRQGVESPE